ncbi:MAG: M16 family metallopeptidase [Ignavibacteriales bacterium]
MIRLPRPAAFAAAALLLASCSHLHAPAILHHEAQATAPAAQLKPGQWPQGVSDVPADPAIRFGALPNGMRYAIEKNSTPPGQASLRLYFNAGSLNESDEQQGLAHFLEHMAFNGSKDIPEGEMIKMLERHGLAFGADTNASTSWDQTVYQLDLPQTDPATVDDTLKILRQTAGELTIAQDAVDRERGVVLSEERTRDTPAYRIFKQRLGFLMQGQRPPLRYPIGQVKVLQSAPAGLIADFYKQWYRPERAVLVAVGDFDVDAMETKIRAGFSDWEAQKPAIADPDVGAVQKRGPEALVAVEPGSQLSVQMSWMAPPDLARDTVEKRKHDWRELLGFAVLNRRLETIARAEDPPFIAAGGFRDNQFRAAEVTTLSVTAKPGDWQGALAAIEREQRRAAQYGVRQDELDREIAELRAQLKTAADGSATRRTPALAAQIVNSLEENDIVTSPAEDLAIFEAAVKDLKAEQVSDALRAAFSGAGPLIFLASPDAVQGGNDAVLAAYKTSQAVAVTPPAAPVQVSWPYESFGPSGQVVEQREVADLDTVFVRFANGVRLTVKPTKFRKEQVLVRVNVGDGRLALSKDRQSMVWAASSLIEGGLKQISAEDMERVLASKVYGANFGVDNRAFVLSGQTRTDDVPTQLEVLAAYVAEPGWRPEAFQRIKSYTSTLEDQYEATDNGVLGRDLPGLLHAGDRRWTFPSRQEVAHATLKDLESQIAPSLADGPIEVVMVGDITVDKAIDEVADTFGALPPRPQAAAPSADAQTSAFPDPGGPLVETHKGRADQSIGLIAWKTQDFFTSPQTARTLAVLGEAFEIRLVEELRENQGDTYSPNVSYHQSTTFPGWGYMLAQVEVPPAKLDAFFAKAQEIAAELRDKPVSADLLSRARNPRVEQLEKAQATNEYWLSELSFAQTDPRRLDAIRSLVPQTERVTAADVQAAARRFLTDDEAWKLVIRPR